MGCGCSKKFSSGGRTATTQSARFAGQPPVQQQQPAQNTVSSSGVTMKVGTNTFKRTRV